MDAFTVIFYEKDDGSKPAQVFIDSLSDKQRAKTIRDLKLLAAYGNYIREPQSRSLRDGLYELRTKQGSDISRILYFFFVGKKIVLTNGFLKKSMKTPKNEIELALKYKIDFENRSK